MKSLPPRQWPTIWGAIPVSFTSCSRPSSGLRWRARTAWNKARPLTPSSAFPCQSRGSALKTSTSTSSTSASSRDRFESFLFVICLQILEDSFLRFSDQPWATFWNFYGIPRGGWSFLCDSHFLWIVSESVVRMKIAVGTASRRSSIPFFNNSNRKSRNSSVSEGSSQDPARWVWIFLTIPLRLFGIIIYIF